MTPREAALAVQQTVQDGVTSLGNRSKAVVDTGMGVLTLLRLPTKSSSVSIEASSGSRLALSSEVLQELPQGAVLGILPIADGLFKISGTVMASPPLEVSVYDEQGSYVRVELSTPLLLRLPGSGAGEDFRCRYLETKGGPRWSTEGVWKASEAEVRAAGEDPAGTWCWTLHLSIFAAILEAVLGCTNVELLSSEALSAVVERQGWYRANASLITFAIAGILVQALLIGVAWERWQMRLGRTHETRKKVKCCGSLLSCGPQLLKHKYAVFLVYARDLLKCMTSERRKLKNGSLTSGVQRFLAVRYGISVACVSQHCWNGGSWLDSKASLPKTTLCRKLEFHGGVAEALVEQELFGRGLLRVLRRFIMTVLAVHPLLDAMRVGAGSLTVLKRTSLQLCGLFGVVATNSLIFNFSGGLRSWEADAECPIEPSSQSFMLVASLVSVAVNVLPNAFLMDVAKQVHGRPLWNLGFWLLLAGFLSCTGLLIVVALANLNSRDQAKWYASLEWSMAIKLLGMPLAQGLRQSLMLEAFLRLDRSCPAELQFKAVVGLSHPNEAPLREEARREAMAAATRAISAEGLVKFASLLGGRLMPDFDAATSTSREVGKAMKALCIRAPDMEAVAVEVIEARGLGQDSTFGCSILRLGRQVQRGRAIAAEHESEPLRSDAGVCSWAHRAEVLGLDTKGALGFRVRGRNGKLVTAWLPAEEIFRAGGWAGELPLQEGAAEPQIFEMPVPAASVPAMHVTVSRSCPGQARLMVKVRLPKGYLQALAIQEWRSLKDVSPQDVAELAEEAMRTSPLAPQADPGLLGTEAFCEALEAGPPPERLVLHSGHGSFLELVGVVVSDALGEAAQPRKIRQFLEARDFLGLLDMLTVAQRQGVRYWIDIFALDPETLEQEQRHESLLRSMPTLLRQLRWASCQHSVQEIEAGKEAMEGLTQLLVLDSHSMREGACMAEMMLAKAMRMKQRLVVHADKGATLAAELQKLEAQELPWTGAFLRDKQAVLDHLRHLATEAAREQDGNGDATWHDLGAADVAAAAAAAAASRHDRGEVDDPGALELGDMDS